MFYNSLFKLITIILISLHCISNVFAQPANNNPCNATPVTVAAPGVCNYITSDNTGATGAIGIPIPWCTAYNGGEVWFSAVVPIGGTVTFDTQIGGMLDGGMAIYTGTCGALVIA